ncbi:MAG: hypothetical protein ACXQT4_05140 [Methanotrichaceae archaeon]
MREKKIFGLTISLAVIHVIVVTIALVALAFGVVTWVIGVENMATFEKFMSAYSSVMVSILIIAVVLIVLSLLWMLARWLSKKEEGIKILPFEVTKGEDQYSSEAISHLLTAELQRISRIHSEEYEEASRSIEPENLTQFYVLPTKAPTPENLTSSIADVGVVAVPGGASISLGELLVVLKALWPWGDTGQIISGSLQKYGSMISLVVCLVQQRQCSRRIGPARESDRMLRESDRT